MMGQRQFETKLYYQLSLERLVPEDHLLRRVASAVDFSFVRPLCRPFYSHTGQPSVDPVVIFKMLLVGFLYGITSERRLVQEVSLHLAYRWFCGYDFDVPTPDHSVLRRHSQVRGTQRVQYRAPKGSCAACPFRGQCTPSGGERTIHRSWGQEFVEANE